MPFAFVQSASNSIDVAGTTITVALTGVAAGNLIALWVKHEGAATTILHGCDEGRSRERRPEWSIFIPSCLFGW